MNAMPNACKRLATFASAVAGARITDTHDCRGQPTAVLTVGAKVYEFHVELIRLAYHRSDTVVLQGSYSDWTLRMGSKEDASALVAAWAKWEEQCPF